MTDRGAFVQLREAHAYTRAPPRLYNLASDDPILLRWFHLALSEERVDCPPEGYIRVRNIYLLNGKHALTADGEWIEETIHDWTARDAVTPMMRGIIAGKHNSIRATDKSRPSVILFKAGSSNYGHFLTDIAPKLINVAHAGIRKIRLIMPDEGKAFAPTVEELCDRLGIDAELSVTNKQELAFIEEALIFTPVSRHARRKSQTLRELRDLAVAMHGSPEKAFRKVFVDRPNGRWRRISNGDAIAACFASRGFEIVDPAALGWCDQVRLFSECTHIAGPLGAGLANAMFASSEAQVLMLDNGLSDFWFWDLSSLFKQRFHWFFCGPLQHWSRDLALNDYPVDVDNLSSSLRIGGW